MSNFATNPALVSAAAAAVAVMNAADLIVEAKMTISWTGGVYVYRGATFFSTTDDTSMPYSGWISEDGLESFETIEECEESTVSDEVRAAIDEDAADFRAEFGF
jgi:hypothetical protein